MSASAAEYSPPFEGAPAPVARSFAWIMLATVAAYMINNALVVGFGFPGVRAIASGDPLTYAQAAIYLAAGALALAYVVRTPDRALRWDAHRISAFNAWLIRACFFSVLLVGLADVLIAFLRTEDFLVDFMSKDQARNFGLARFVGAYVHLPLIAVGIALAFFSRTLGFTWLALLIVLAELLIVISRFVFSYEQALMGDLVRYWYAALFLFASAHTLMEEGHVRVDILYAGMGKTRKGLVNAFGSTLLGMTTAWVIITVGFGSKSSIINSPVMNFEVTQTGGVGMFVKYQMAAFLGIFAISMLVQFVSYFLEAVADMRDEPGKREVQAASSH